MLGDVLGSANGSEPVPAGPTGTAAPGDLNWQTVVIGVKKRLIAADGTFIVEEVWGDLLFDGCNRDSDLGAVPWRR
jgi:hypothetical protein